MWNNKNGRVSIVLNSTGQFLFHWQSARNQSLFCTMPSNLDQGSVCWVKPQVGWLKCNVDVTTFASRGIVGYGGVIRHSNGSFVAAKCGYLFGNFGAREVEALSVREILNWLKGLQFPYIVIEMDCLKVYNALVDKFSSPNGFGLIIDDCRALAMSVREVIFSFARRSANTTTHVIAQVRGSLSGPEEWGHVPPPWLIYSLYNSSV